jgi:hypothetical protein
MAQRQFITRTTEPTPYRSASWAMIDGLLHVRSAIGTKVADLLMSLVAIAMVVAG